MAEEQPRYHGNDVDPFASIVHSIVRGSGPQEVSVDMRDRDVMLNIQVDADTFRLLHLQNVREDTIDQAHVVIDAFLDQLRAAEDASLSSSDSREAHIMLMGLEPVHLDMGDYIEEQAEKRGLAFDWGRGSYPRDSFRTARSQPKYLVRFTKDGGREYVTGSRPVMPWAARAADGIAQPLSEQVKGQ